MLTADADAVRQSNAESHERAWFRELRSREFARLDRAGEAYLDFTGSALFASSQLRAHAELLERTVLGNPHAESGASLASTAHLERARGRVLRFLGAGEGDWEVVFTYNATAAIRLVAEGYPFDARRACVLSADNHNSVNGVREWAAARGARVHYLPLDDELRLDDPERELRALAAAGARGLVAFPSQSNFSGVRHPLSLARTARELGFEVLLDAASHAPTAPLALDEVAADFVPVSLYKVLGYPTGLGALVARRTALARLSRPSFAGGTVQFASVQRRVHLLQPGAAGFEDGTPSFLAAAALPAGFDLLEEVGMARLSRRVEALTGLLLDRLAGLRHDDGSPAVAIYGPATVVDRGGCVAINVLDERGVVIPYETVEARARAERVSLRGGCFCNPGAAERAFGLTATAARCQTEALRGGFSIPRFRACLGGDSPVGAVRISVGLPTMEEEIERVVDVLRSCARNRGRPVVSDAR